MSRAALYILCLALTSVSRVDAQTEPVKPGFGLSPSPGVQFDAAALQQLLEEIADASPEQFFSVDLVFDKPVRVKDLHAAALQLRIPRVLAYVEYGPLFDGRPRNLFILGLGEMYASEQDRRHTQCRALIHISYGEENELRSKPIEDWAVNRVHVDATAHAIRDLQAGSLLPAGNVFGGGSAKLEHMQILTAYTRDEVSKKIEIPGNIEVPQQCGRQVAPLDAPVLAADFDASFTAMPRLENEGFREYAFRNLAILPPDSAVTIRLKLDFPADVETLAALVSQYQIDGLSAELVPERSDKLVIADAELSIHGAALGDQIRRVRCQLRLGSGPQLASEWYADWVAVSLSATKAYVFLSYPHLSLAEIVGKFPIDDLERLVAYYQRTAEEAYEVPDSFDIPPGCGDFYSHP